MEDEGRRVRGELEVVILCSQWRTSQEDSREGDESPLTSWTIREGQDGTANLTRGYARRWRESKEAQINLVRVFAQEHFRRSCVWARIAHMHSGSTRSFCASARRLILSQNQSFAWSLVHTGSSHLKQQQQQQQNTEAAGQTAHQNEAASEESGTHWPDVGSHSWHAHFSGTAQSTVGESQTCAGACGWHLDVSAGTLVSPQTCASIDRRLVDMFLPHLCVWLICHGMHNTSPSNPMSLSNTLHI